MRIFKKIISSAITLTLAISAMALSTSAEGVYFNLTESPTNKIAYICQARFIAEDVELDSARARRACNNGGSGDLVFVKKEPYFITDDKTVVIYVVTYNCRSCGKNSSYISARQV